MVGATSWLLPVGAFVGALGATAIVQGVGYGRASRSTASLLLVGMALNLVSRRDHRCADRQRAGRGERQIGHVLAERRPHRADDGRRLDGGGPAE
jgi:hypothetical protein